MGQIRLHVSYCPKKLITCENDSSPVIKIFGARWLDSCLKNLPFINIRRHNRPVNRALVISYNLIFKKLLLTGYTSNKSNFSINF